MKTVIIVQARMTSTRLPGKVLKEVIGKPLLEYQIERLRRIPSADEIVIATTTNDTDQPIADLCKRLNVPYYRGSEDDVLARYYEAAAAFEADTVVRVTADCPVIDPAISDAAIDFFLQNSQKYDYVSLAGYPRGLDTEVFSFAALEECWQEATAQPDREHVTPYIYHHPERYHIERLVCSNEALNFLPVSLRGPKGRGNLPRETQTEKLEGDCFTVVCKDNPSYSLNDYSHHRWTVDTAEDFELIRRIIEELYSVKPEFSMHDVLTVLEQYPAWVAINAEVRQKQYGE